MLFFLLLFKKKKLALSIFEIFVFFFKFSSVGLVLHRLEVAMATAYNTIRQNLPPPSAFPPSLPPPRASIITQHRRQRHQHQCQRRPTE